MKALVPFLLSALIGLAPFCIATGQQYQGAVATAHPLATLTGIEILKKGGNAFDAAIAIAASLNVTEPMMSGMGGYGTILIYDAAKKETRFLNCSGKIPVNTNSDLMRPPTPDYMKNRFGAKAVSTPGNLHAWETMHSEYGKLEWSSLFMDAIQYSEQGFPVSKRLGQSISNVFAGFSDYTKDFYGKAGMPLKEGDTLFQHDLAKTFKKIAKNKSSAFYSGEIAFAIDKIMKEKQGFLSLKDLETDKAEWWKPVMIRYKGYDVYTAAPPANSFAALIGLGIMQQSGSNHLKHQSAEYIHLVAEILKQTFYYRLKYSGDPFLNPPPMDYILSEKFLDSAARQLNLEAASEFKYPFSSPASNNTTHFVVSDKWGNIVCATQTLGDLFGSKIMAEGTGVWLNNSLAYCSYEPKGNPMDAFPGHYKLSGDCPVIIMKDNLPWAAAGTPGGHSITQNVAQIVFNLIDYNMTMQEAIDTPKITFAEPDRLIVEAAIPDSVREHLKKMGHNILTGNVGNATGIKFKRDKNKKIIRAEAAADKRGIGTGRSVN